MLCTTYNKINAQINVSITVAPPALMTYHQPVCPGDGYMWIPGYWAYNPESGYYWVSGYWSLPPNPGLLWTPGYWGFVGGSYMWHAGYWGAHIGFYGGINYGFGYFGSGYNGGMWRGNTFVYNTAVTNVNRTVIHNTYVDNHYTVINNNNHYSFNGRGGVQARPTAMERQYAGEQHFHENTQQRMVSHSMMANNERHTAFNSVAMVRYNNNANRMQMHQNIQENRPRPQNAPQWRSAPHPVNINRAPARRSAPVREGGKGWERR